jgi:hypothetical protein
MEHALSRVDSRDFGPSRRIILYQLSTVDCRLSTVSCNRVLTRSPTSTHRSSHKPFLKFHVLVLSQLLTDSLCEVGPQARPWLNRAWARQLSPSADVVTVTPPVATVTVVDATSNRVLCPTLVAEEARLLVR